MVPVPQEASRTPGEVSEKDDSSLLPAMSIMSKKALQVSASARSLLRVDKNDIEFSPHQALPLTGKYLVTKTK